MPELRGTLAYLRCRRAANFEHYDHTDPDRGHRDAAASDEGEPLLYARRRMDWLLRALRVAPQAAS